MMVRADRIHIPADSSIGFGEGEDIETTERVSFIGDSRMMRDIGEGILAAGSEVLDLPVVEVPEWALR